MEPIMAKQWVGNDLVEIPLNAAQIEYRVGILVERHEMAREQAIEALRRDPDAHLRIGSRTIRLMRKMKQEDREWLDHWRPTFEITPLGNDHASAGFDDPDVHEWI